jgi:hypothetical protein
MNHKIQSDAELEVNLELIQGMYRSIAELHRRVAPQNFTNYLVFAEGPIERIRRLKAEIDEYLGITAAVAQAEEDARDLATFEEREHEPPLPFREFLAEKDQPLGGDSNVARA